MAQNNKISVEKIPALIKRCPQCQSLTIEFDTATSAIKCTKCGFEQKLKTQSPKYEEYKQNARKN